MEPVEEEERGLKEKMNRTNFSLSSNFLFPLCVSTFGSTQQFRIAQNRQHDSKR